MKSTLLGIWLLGIIASGVAHAEVIWLHYDADGNPISEREYNRQLDAYNSFYSGRSSGGWVTTYSSGWVTTGTRYRTTTSYGPTYSTTNNYGTSYYTQNNYGSSYGTINNYGNSHLTINNYGNGRTTVNDYGSSRTTVNRRRR